MARQGPRRARKVKMVGQIRAAVMVEEEEEEDRPPPPGFLPEWDGTEESFLDALATGRTLRNTPKLFVSAMHTYSQQLAEKEYQKKEIRPVEEIVPNQYHEYLRVFSKDVTTGCRVRSGRLTRMSRGVDEHLCNESGARLDSQAGDKLY